MKIFCCPACGSLETVRIKERIYHSESAVTYFYTGSKHTVQKTPSKYNNKLYEACRHCSVRLSEQWHGLHSKYSGNDVFRILIGKTIVVCSLKQQFPGKTISVFTFNGPVAEIKINKNENSLYYFIKKPWQTRPIVMFSGVKWPLVDAVQAAIMFVAKNVMPPFINKSEDLKYLPKTQKSLYNKLKNSTLISLAE